MWIPVSVFVPFFFVCLRRIAAAIIGNLDPVLGPASAWRRQAWAFRTMWGFAWCMVERFEHLWRPDSFTVSVEGAERIAAHEGIVFVTAHLGHWEMASHVASPGLRREVHVVREEELDPRAQKFLEDLLRDHVEAGYHTHFASGDPRLASILAEALRRGEIVALQGDRPRSQGRTVTVGLFGQPMQLPVGPPALARATSVSLLPLFCLREGRLRYRIVVREPIRVPHTSNREADIAAAATAFAAHLEWAIREAPHQWFCFRKLWPPLSRGRS